VRLGCSTISLRTSVLDDACGLIAAAGFTVVDLGAVPTWCDHVNLLNGSPEQLERIRTTVERHAFRVAGIQAVPRIPDATDDLAELRRRHEVALDAAIATGSMLLVDPGTGIDCGRAAGLSRFARTIEMIAELARDRGVGLAIEAPNHGTLASTLDETLSLLELIDMPDLGIDLDTFHVFNCGSAAEDVVTALGDRIVHVACRDGRGDGTNHTPGDGDFDFGDFFSQLARIDYSGDVTLELIPDHEQSPAERSAHVVRARDWVEPMLNSSGLVPRTGTPDME
jgi:sugar phosphate isomerase/epimerase